MSPIPTKLRFNKANRTSNGVLDVVDVRLERVLSIDPFLNFLVLLLKLLSLLDHAINLLLGKTALVIGDGDFLTLSGALVLSRHLQKNQPETKKQGLKYIFVPEEYRWHRSRRSPRFEEHRGQPVANSTAQICRADGNPLSWIAHPRKPGSTQSAGCPEQWRKSGTSSLGSQCCAQSAWSKHHQQSRYQE
mmetsp:Transcript_43166/g.90369  ORF Transcript_43166/g.90369 Transcript_43166/m.90369 type:complete len:190 (+) Transcript_43166:533-1102(+)